MKEFETVAAQARKIQDVTGEEVKIFLGVETGFRFRTASVTVDRCPCDATVVHYVARRRDGVFGHHQSPEGAAFAALVELV